MKNSPLKDTITFEDGVPDITILNPTQAKGLEYPNVAIFGFNTIENNSLQILYRQSGDVTPFKITIKNKTITFKIIPNK